MARHCFKAYVSFLEEHRPEAMTLVAHLTLHLCEDAEFFKTHLGAISCYPFENFERVFGKVNSIIRGIINQKRPRPNEAWIWTTNLVML